MLLSVEQLANALAMVNAKYGDGFNRVECSSCGEIRAVVVWSVKDYGFVVGDREQGVLVNLVDEKELNIALANKKFEADDLLDIIILSDEMQEQYEDMLRDYDML